MAGSSRQVQGPGPRIPCSTCGCFLLLLPFLLIYWGWQGVHDAVAFPRPVVLTYDEFVRRSPKEGWFTITGGELDLLRAAWQTTPDDDGTPPIHAAFTPVRAAGRASGETRLLVTGHIYDAVWKLYDLARESETMRTEGEMHSVESEAIELATGKGEEAASAEDEALRHRYRLFLKNHAGDMRIKKELEGMVEGPGGAVGYTEWDDLRKVGPDLVHDYILLREGARPNYGAGLAQLIIGLVLVLGPLLAIVISALLPKRPEPEPPSVSQEWKPPKTLG